MEGSVRGTSDVEGALHELSYEIDKGADAPTKLVNGKALARINTLAAFQFEFILRKCLQGKGSLDVVVGMFENKKAVWKVPLLK